MPISIHAPAKGATSIRSFLLRSTRISIHAPAKGATKTIAIISTIKVHFNPRSREGSDFTVSGFLKKSILFQSTLPRRERHIQPTFYSVAHGFQSTLPRRERRTSTYACADTLKFQSTLPRRERLVDLMTKAELMKISIHAPAKGATLQQV